MNQGRSQSLRLSNQQKLIPQDLSASLGKPPPQAIDMEQAVLGAMMLERAGLINTIDILQPEDFYLEKHREIFQAIRDLFRADHPVDMRTVRDQLQRTGKLELVGGAYTMADLTDKVSSAANAEYHARVICEMSIRRKLIMMASQIQQEAYEDTNDVFETLDKSQQAFDQVTSLYLKGNVKSAKAVYTEAIENLLAGRGKEGLIGVPSGYTELDRLTAGWMKTNLTIIAGRPGMGKALGLNEEILTDNWWVKMRDIKVGMKVAASDGKFYPVNGVYPQGIREVYDVHFDDGTVVRCDEEHLWKVKSRYDRKTNKPARVVSLRDMLNEPIILAGNRKNYSIEYCTPIEYSKNAHYIHPYILGVLLGDGDLSNKAKFDNPEEDIVQKVQGFLPYNYTIHSYGIARNIRRIDMKGAQVNLVVLELDRLLLLTKLAHEKHIPLEYLMDSVENRIQLLQGLMDTDGFVTDSKSAFVEYTTTSKQLSDDVAELVRSLGGKAVTSIKDTHYTKHARRVPCRPAYRILIAFANDGIIPVSSKKHLKRLRPKRFFSKFITDVVKVGQEETQCISVASPDNTFLTNNYTITHNTAFVVNVLRNAAIDFKIPVAIFSLEMSRLQLMQRMISAESEVDLDRIIKCSYDDTDLSIITNKTGRLSSAPIFIDDTAALSILELRAKSRRLKAENNIQLIVVDYLQLMRGDKEGNREQEISSISRALKGMAKDLDVPVLALSQLSRAVETRGGDKRPILADLRESGSIEQDADIVMFLFRPEYYKITAYEDGSPTQGTMEVIVAKNRNGRPDTVKLKFIGKYSKVKDMDAYDVPSLPFTASTPGNFKLYKNNQISRNEHGDGSDDSAPF